MPDYLPLCAFRLDLLPVACRSCAWWLASGLASQGQDAAKTKRRDWMAALESTWGSVGLLCLAEAATDDPAAIRPLAAIHYAPVSEIPRLRDLPLGPLPADAALLFCLRVEGSRNQALAGRLLQKALAELRRRRVEKVFAYGVATGGETSQPGNNACGFFSVELLEDRGFQHVRDNGRLFLMRSDLGGLVAILSQIEGAVKRVLGAEPAPSPVAWSNRQSP